MFFISLASPVSAKSYSTVLFMSNDDAQKFISERTDDIIYEGDTSITKNDVEVGLYYAELNQNLNNSVTNNSVNSNKNVNNLSSGYETWTITSAVTIVPYGVVKGLYKTKVAVGMTQSTSYDFSFGLSGSIKGAPIDASVSWSKTTSYSGPSGTEIVASGYYATHRVFSALGSAKVVKYTYRVTDMYTGSYLRTEIKNYAADVTTNTYANFVNINPSTGAFKVKSASSTSFKTITNEAIWAAKVNSTSSPEIYVYF